MLTCYEHIHSQKQLTMSIRNLFNTNFDHRKPMKGFVILAFMLFSIHPAWAQDDEGASNSQGQSSYPNLQPAGFLQGHFSAYDQADRPSAFSIHRARFGFAGDISSNLKLNLIVGARNPPTIHRLWSTPLRIL